MNAYLTHPVSGETNVDPQTEIVVVFEDPYSNLDSVNLKVDGEWAVRQGETQTGFVCTRSFKHKDKIHWGVRREGGLHRRDVMVQGWSSKKCALVEQRFFVRGARHSREMYVNKPNFCVTTGGVLQSDHEIFPCGAELTVQGEVKFRGESWWIPTACHTEVLDISSHNGRWVSVSSDKRSTYVLKSHEAQIYNFPSKKVKICGGLINLQIDGKTSAHLPLSYEPSHNERTLDDWWTLGPEDLEDEEWNMEFGSGLHVWWNENRMIARHDPKPILGMADDVLWEYTDIGQKFESVKVLTPHNVLVNKKLYLNTYHPEITEI